MSRLLLTRDELVELTGKARSDAHRRALDRMGISYRQRPDGSLAVLRSHVEAVLGAAAPAGTITPREPELRL